MPVYRRSRCHEPITGRSLKPAFLAGSPLALNACELPPSRIGPGAAASARTISNDKTPPRNLFGAYKLTRIQLNISVTNVLGRYIAILLIQTILMTILNLEDGNQEIVEKLSAGLRVYRKQFVAW